MADPITDFSSKLGEVSNKVKEILPSFSTFKSTIDSLAETVGVTTGKMSDLVNRMRELGTVFEEHSGAYRLLKSNLEVYKAALADLEKYIIENVVSNKELADTFSYIRDESKRFAEILEDVIPANLSPALLQIARQLSKLSKLSDEVLAGKVPSDLSETFMNLARFVTTLRLNVSDVVDSLEKISATTDKTINVTRKFAARFSEMVKKMAGPDIISAFDQLSRRMVYVRGYAESLLRSFES